MSVNEDRERNFSKADRSSSEPDRIIIGKFGAPYGVRGWIKVNSYTDPIDTLLENKQWQVEHQGQWQTLDIETGKVHGKQLAVKIEGIDNRDEVHRFTNDLIAIAREELTDLPEGEYYQADLIGCEVETIDGVKLGKLIEFMATGANDVMVVETDTKKRLIPYVDHVLKNIDLKTKKIAVDWDPDF